MSSQRRPVELRRSWLFVPGLDTAAQAAGLASGADVLVADLEEFTAPADRPAARMRITTLLAECRAAGVVGAVRINRLEDDGLADLRGVMPGAPDVVFLPHCEQVTQIEALDDALTACEHELGLPAGSTEIAPTLESALGVLHTHAIASASPRVSACLLAAGDLGANLGAQHGPDALELRHARARFHVDCTAAGRTGIDCPFNYRDDVALRADLQWAIRIGVRAKCSVYPEQVAALHALLTPQPEAVQAARACVARFEAAAAGRPQAGAPVDPPDYQTARRLLARDAAYRAWGARVGRPCHRVHPELPSADRQATETTLTATSSTRRPSLSRRNGGQILMQQLRIHGVRRVFLVPGESYLPCIDALNEHSGSIEPIVCRQESGAAYMAEAMGKLTGEPGICFVTRGPGATNASIGVHTAFQDSTPMILFVGQVGNDFYEREAFQEIDYRRMFGQMAKWVAQIDRTERIPEYIARAFSVATSGRPGPVVLALPEDTLWGTAEVADLPRYQRSRSHPGTEDMRRLASLLEEAERPFMIVGGSGWTRDAISQVEGFATRFQLPVGTAWRRLECFDQRSPNAAGHVGWAMTPELRRRVREADLILAVGTRLGEATTEGYAVIESPMPRQKLVHVYPDAGELGRVFAPTQAIVADVVGFAAALAPLEPGRPMEREAWIAAARADYLASLEPLPSQGPLSLDEIAVIAARQLPDDACITVGAGNYALYPHRYRQFTGPGTSLTPTVGSMGYGLPAAISAKLENPDRTVVCYAGDGCFQMNLQELGVALQYRIGVVVLVFNNGIWGTIRSHQEREFPGRDIALSFTNPDFSALVRSYGGHGEVVERTEDFSAALSRACEFADRERLPALIELRYDADSIAPGETLAGIREDALARRRAGAAGN